MRRVKRYVAEKRFARMILSMFLEAVNRVLGRGDRGVVILFVRRRLYRHVVQLGAGRGEVVARIALIERAIKAAGQNLAIDMPLAAVITAIAGRFKIIGQEPRPGLANALYAPA